MNYKEKYEQCIECIQEILSAADDTIKTSILRTRLQPFFHEIEDENESIRKEIICILKGETRYTSKEDTDKYIAWLEKQGEQKPVWSEEDEKFFNDTIGFFEEVKNAIDHSAWIKSLKQRIIG